MQWHKMLAFKALLHHQAIYLYQMLNTRLQSSGTGLLVKLETSNKTSDRAFIVAAATTWNHLPLKVRIAATTEQFSYFEVSSV